MLKADMTHILKAGIKHSFMKGLNGVHGMDEAKEKQKQRRGCLVARRERVVLLEVEVGKGVVDLPVVRFVGSDQRHHVPPLGVVTLTPAKKKQRTMINITAPSLRVVLVVVVMVVDRTIFQYWRAMSGAGVSFHSGSFPASRSWSRWV